MKILKRILIVLVLLVLIALTVVYLFRKRLIKSVVPEIAEVYIQNLVIENGKGRAHLVLYLENKDVIDYNVTAMDLKLHSGSLELMHYKRDSSYILNAGERKEFDLEFDIDTQQLVKRIRSLQEKDSTTVLIAGNIVFATYLGFYKLDINKNVTVRVPTPPDIKIREIEYLGIRNGDSIDFNLHIGVLNYNPNILGIKDVTYHFSGEEFFEARGSLPDVQLDTSDTIVRILPITVVTKRKMELLSKIILNEDKIGYQVKIDGILLLKNDKHNELNISITKKAKLELYKKNKKSKIKFTNKRKEERKRKRLENKNNP